MSFGLVLAGGGVRGAYHIGVWKALREMNIDICAVSGSSIGAINGALFAQGDFDTAYRLWEQISLSDIVSLPPELESEIDLFDLRNIVKIARLARKDRELDMKPLENLLNRVIDENAVRSSGIEFGLTAYSLTEKRLVTLYKENIPKGKLIPYLMASASLPGFKSREIGREKFIDGGMANNMPVDMIIGKGIDDIITVNVKGIGFYRDFNTAGRNIIPIEWKRAALGTMDFDRGAIKRCITEGYLDCKREFGRLFGRECYFKASEYEYVRSKYGKSIIDGIQWAAKAFGLNLLREVSFEELAKEVTAAYLINRGLTESTSEIKYTDKTAVEKLSKLDDISVICRLVGLLDAKGFDFAKSKLDILGRNYGAASALLYFKRLYCRGAG